MPRALILAEQDLPTYYRLFLAGLTPSPLPYGINALQGHGYRLRGLNRTTNPGLQKLRDVVEHRVGFPVEQTLRGLPKAASADVVIALLEHQGSLAGLLKSRGIPPYSSTPLVIWSCWLADDVRRAGPRRRAELLERYRAADLITHMSPHESEILLELGLAQEQIASIEFGIDHDYYVPDDSERDIEVLSVGQDRGRDYATLIEAVRGTDLRIDIVCKPDNLVGLDIPANVTVHTPVSLPAYRALLRRAQVVAVPTHDLAYPTGQSVALEASSVGACVAVTGTRAMRHYFTPSTAHLVEVGDIDGWREGLNDLLNDPWRRHALGVAARAAVVERFNADRMWAQVADLLQLRGLV